MDIHVRRLGTLNILFGAASLLVSSLFFLIYGGPLGLYRSTDDNILGLLMAAATVAHFLLAVPCILGGVFLRQMTEWSRGLVIVTSALNILNVPAGSILGAYGLWVLLTPEVDPLFSMTAQNRAAEAAHKALHSPDPPERKSTATETRIVPSPRS
jgi:hypothetical protein